MNILEPDERKLVDRHSSISQYKGFLAVRRGDQWVPIAYDILDGIACDKVHSHKGVLTREPHVGYHFPVKHCTYLSETYVASDQKGIELKALPEEYGAGFYESAYNREVIVNSDNGALGMANRTTLDVGLDYVLAESSLEPAD